MQNYWKNMLAYQLFVILGCIVLLITLFEIGVGRTQFLFIIASLGPFSIAPLIGLYILALITVVIGIQVKGDLFLTVLSIVTILYSILSVDNILYVFNQFIVKNDTFELVSIGYALACITIGLRWFLHEL